MGRGDFVGETESTVRPNRRHRRLFFWMVGVFLFCAVLVPVAPAHGLEIQKAQLIPPYNLEAVPQSGWIQLSWDAIPGATDYLVKRTGDGELEEFWLGAPVTEFSDNWVEEKLTYTYTVTSADVWGKMNPPSSPVSSVLMPAEFEVADYKVTAKGYTLSRDTSNNLFFRGKTAGTIKIKRLKQLPPNATDNPEKGIYYLTNLGQANALLVEGHVKTLMFDVPVDLVSVEGKVGTLQSKTAAHLVWAQQMASVKIASSRPMESKQYARTLVGTDGSKSFPLTILSTGTVIETLDTPQPVKRIGAASKSYLDKQGEKWTSLGALGTLPRVEAHLEGKIELPCTAIPSAIVGKTFNAVTASGGPIVLDFVIGDVARITVAGGSIRCGEIQSGKDLALLQAKARWVEGTLVGGAVGVAGYPEMMIVKVNQNIRKVYGEMGISGYFHAGYDTATGSPMNSGGIGVLQTKSGVVEGAVLLDPAKVKNLKVLPPTANFMAINPNLP